MQLDDDGDRQNVEDRRGTSLGRAGLKLGVGGTLVLLVLSVVLKRDMFSMLGATTDADTVASYSNSASFLSLLAPESRPSFRTALARTTGGTVPPQPTAKNGPLSSQPP